MLRVIVRLNGQNLQTLELDDPATIYWAGRSDHCQIPLKAHESISRQHFKIFFKDGLWHLEVVSPFSEVYVDGAPTKVFPLKEGLAFAMQPYEFFVESPHTLALTNPNLSLNQEDKKGSDGEADDKTVTRTIHSQAQKILRYRSPDNNEEQLFPLTRETYRIGRDPGCDIVLDDARVSRRQFKLVLKDNLVSLVDSQGLNGTFINKNKVSSKDPILLNSGDKIVVLNHRFTFEIRDPNFESKVEKVKHLALAQPIIPGSAAPPSAFPSTIPDGERHLVPGGGPTHHQSMADAHPSPLPSVPELNLFGKKIPLTKQNKFRLGLFIFAFLALVIISSDETSDFDAQKDVQAKPADPFSKLPPKEQELIKSEYSTATDLYNQGNFVLAKDRILAIHSKIPYYLDSKELLKSIEIGIKSNEEYELEARRKREEAELQEQVQNTVAFCRQQIKPTTTSAEIEECLDPVIQLSPEHELIVKLRTDVSLMEEERKLKAAQEALIKAQIEELRSLYKKAYDIGEKNPLQGIAEFNKFLELTMPDPDKLQQKAKNDIKRLRGRIKAKVDKAIDSVKNLVESGKHKEAIISLEKASEVAPGDDSLKQAVARITEELRKKMQGLYHEAILEENIGNIDTAKDRWSKILERDIPNGEYFEKAKTKLNKYGGP